VHEWALAEGVLDTVRDVARKEGLRRVTRIEVRVGELQSIDCEVFSAALAEVLPREHRDLDGASIQVLKEPVSFRCRSCGTSFSLGDRRDGLDPGQRESIHFVPELSRAHLNCTACGSPDFEVTSGRGVRLHAVEGE